jgi:hypothetical protein
MVEILPPGTEVETYGMPAESGMNGVKGVIVCYNATTGRYTFEDDAGSMMSLRAKNLKAIDEFVQVGTVNEDQDNEEPTKDEKGSDQDGRKEENKKGSNEEPTNDENGSSTQGRKYFRINDIVQYVNNRVIKKAKIIGIDFIGAKPIYTIRLLDSGVEKSARPADLMWPRKDEKGSDQDRRKTESEERSTQGSRQEKKGSEQDPRDGDDRSPNEEPRIFRINDMVAYVRNGENKRARIIGVDRSMNSYAIRLLDSGLEKNTVSTYLYWSDQDSGEDVNRSYNQEQKVFRINDIVAYVRNGEHRRARVIGVDYIGSQPSYTIHMLDSGVEKRTSGTNLFLVSAGQAPAAPARQPNPLDQFLFNVYKTVIKTFSPTTLCVILLAFWWMSSSSSPSPSSSASSGSHYNDHYYHRPYHHWGWWGYCGWGTIVGGLGSLVLVGIFTHKLGTNNGRMAFRWDRAWDRLMMMDFWELIRLAAIFETALYFLGHVGGVGRRRR